jgi:hypothetical protein
MRCFGKGVRARTRAAECAHSVEKGMARAAAAAIRLLNGERAGDLNIAPTQFELPRFDWRQMQRFGMGESNLPPGSIVYFESQICWRGINGNLH